MIATDILLLNLNKKRKKLWGIADLHSHPSSFLAFGSDLNGDNGPIWGKPGMKYNEQTITEDLSKDLAPCDGDKHCGYDPDLIRHETRKSVVATMEKSALWSHGHGTQGWPLFDSWPSPFSTSHQQMHISAIHRAWQGGLRLLVASVIDNQVLSMLWYRFSAASCPSVDAAFDFNSAKRQLTFLNNLALMNGEWMQIVYNPRDAANVIKSGKLAVILGVEMDSLTTWQIKELIREYNVRLVTPIHLADNDFGGAAVYNTAFNTANYFLNNGFFSVIEDANICFRFPEKPSFLRYVSCNVLEGGDLIKHGAMEPVMYPAVVYPRSAFSSSSSESSIPPGHRNSRGLNMENLWELMCEGVLIDVTHMSQNSIEMALQLAEKYKYPLVASHGGLRPGAGPAKSESMIHRDHGKRMAALGGVLGLGTGYNSDKYLSPIQHWIEEYRDMLDEYIGTPVAIGTDMNGLAEQTAGTGVLNDISEFAIPSSEMGFDQPPHIFRNNDAHGLPSGPSAFCHKGLSHYGMLPEFFYAVARESQYNRKNLALFRSADAVVKMWKRIETTTKQQFNGIKFPALHVLVHIQSIGDRTCHENEYAGTRGQGHQLEGFQIDFHPRIQNLGMRYMAHVQDMGDINSIPDGIFIGTRGQGRRIEGFAIELTGADAGKYTVVYMAHLQGLGDTALFQDGQYCGTRGQSRAVEGISVRVKPRT